MKVVVVDDEKWSRDEMCFVLSNLEGVEIVGEASSAHEAAILVLKTNPDAIFLDIDMPGISGLEFAEQLKGMPKEPFIIFVTAHADLAPKAFRLEALDYIVKPFSEETVEESIFRLQKRLKGSSDFSKPVQGKLAVQGEDKTYFLDPNTVDYIKREDRYTLVISKGETYTSTLTLKELEDKLCQYPFLRVHKSFLVNTTFVRSLTAWGNSVYELTLSTSEDVIPVSRTYVKNLKNAIEL
ncbi:LytR/AlgR family response regulator transcription factor [Mangrovibacillus cuniculi]|uniref:Response regulator transcription factor n=1 Tax=Mangrovibacillus cuniculi TaxID=2593652 RepID=A0A7S8HEH9_9BACI|nr:LytTR family DNA-binding domain-containing protein [Mangrovibacillus cuniculi]QPC45758.1 response regulator transcription factor [Mangrovibacillus cuniculi]